MAKKTLKEAETALFRSTERSWQVHRWEQGRTQGSFPYGFFEGELCWADSQVNHSQCASWCMPEQLAFAFCVHIRMWRIYVHANFFEFLACICGTSRGVWLILCFSRDKSWLPTLSSVCWFSPFLLLVLYRSHHITTSEVKMLSTHCAAWCKEVRPVLAYAQDLPQDGIKEL